jgi:hypothetical protein
MEEEVRAMVTTPILRERANQPEAKARLIELVQSQWPGFTVECNDDFDEQGLRVRIERTQDAREFIIENEVLADHTPEAILNRLLCWNWMLFLWECQKTGVVPHFTNTVWWVPGDPHPTRL